MQKKDRKMILFCYENDCGGETVITENFIGSFKKKHFLSIKSFSIDPLAKTDFINYFKWQILSIIKWGQIIWANRSVDVVYVTTYTAGVAAILIKLFAKFKVCFHYHGNRIPLAKIDTDLFHIVLQRIKYTSSYLLHGLFIYNSDLIVVSSTFSINKIIKHFRWVRLTKFRIIPNGVDLARFRKKTRFNDFRRQINLPLSSKMILSVGRIDPIKRVLRLIKVFDKISKEIPNLYLVIAYPKILTNEGVEYKNKLEHNIKKLGLSGQVIWKEDFSDLPAIYRASDLTISLSREENLPMTLLEALASGSLYASSTPGETNAILRAVDKSLCVNSGNTTQQANQIIHLMKMPRTKKEILINRSAHLMSRYNIQNSTSLLIREITSI